MKPIFPKTEHAVRLYQWLDKSCFPLLFVVMTLLLAVIIWLDLPPQRTALSDIFWEMNGGLRYLQGQEAYQDYISHLGETYYLIIAIGIYLFGSQIETLAHTQVLLGVILACIMWWIGRSRLPNILNFALTSYTALILFSPISLGYLSSSAATVAMQYNRFSYALAGIIIIQLLIATPKHLNKHQLIIEGILSGILLFLLTFIKFNATLAVIGIIATSLFFVHTHNILKITSLITFISLLSITGINLIGWLTYNISYIAEKAGSGVGQDRVETLLNTVIYDVIIFSLGIFILFTTLRHIRKSDSSVVLPTFRTFSYAIIFAPPLIGSILFFMNWQHALVQFFPHGIIIGMALTIQHPHTTWIKATNRNFHYYTLLLLLITLLFAPTYFSLMRSIAAASWHKLQLTTFWSESHLSMHSDVTQKLIMLPQPNNNTTTTTDELLSSLENKLKLNAPLNNAEYVLKINNGLDLLKKHIKPDSHIYSYPLNPYPYLLQTPLPTPSILWYYAKGSGQIGKAPNLSLESLFRNIDYVLILKTELDHHMLRKTIEPYVKSHFTIIEQTSIWELYHRY
ncbi:hypothetical protein [Magnetococcus sp. PR-3]|uniref:hypothetical protein n=1 Tax=Magnetococcus sp. PR-3 TaxID=3120355 RepID=UPI002FCE37EE